MFNGTSRLSGCHKCNDTFPPPPPPPLQGTSDNLSHIRQRAASRKAELLSASRDESPSAGGEAKGYVCVCVCVVCVCVSVCAC